MEKKEIKLNHFNIYAVIAIIALIYFSIKCIQFYFEMGVSKEIWETIINFEKFEINLNEIKRITKILMKAPTSFSTNIPALAILWYFKEQKRILIKDINGKEYKIWNIPAKKFSPSTYFRTPKDNVDLYIKELREYLNLEEENIEDSQEIESLDVEMKKLIYSHPDLSEKKESFLILFFFQIFLIFIFLELFSEGITVFYEDGIEILFFIVMSIACIVISYFLIKGMKNAIIYFFPNEEYEIIEDRLYYKKKLKLLGKSFIMKKFDVNLKDIDSISSLPPKISFRGLKCFDDLKPCKRIYIRLKNGLYNKWC